MNKKGLTLIELLIVLVISSILIAGIYRTFIHQQHTYTVQEQVVDMQQSVRIGINQMVREIRMAGFGRTDDEILKNGGGVEGYEHVINPDNGSITFVSGLRQLGTVMEHTGSGEKSIKVTNASSFDGLKKSYISINGTESHRIHSIVGDQINFHDMGKSKFGQLKENHVPGEPVFLVMAVTYSLGLSDGKMCLLRDENLGDGPQPVAENVEFLQFTYTLADGTVFVDTVPKGDRDNIRMVQVSIRARTDRPDPELRGGGDGLRRRTLTSNIQLRNLSSI